MSNPLYPSRNPTFKMLPDASNYKGSFGEIVIDLTLPGLRIMDGCLCGGILQITAELTDAAKAADERAIAAASQKAKTQNAAAAKTLEVTKLEQNG